MANKKEKGKQSHDGRRGRRVQGMFFDHDPSFLCLALKNPSSYTQEICDGCARGARRPHLLYSIGGEASQVHARRIFLVQISPPPNAANFQAPLAVPRPGHETQGQGLSAAVERHLAHPSSGRPVPAWGGRALSGLPELALRGKSPLGLARKSPLASRGKSPLGLARTRLGAGEEDSCLSGKRGGPCARKRGRGTESREHNKSVDVTLHITITN